MYMCVQALNQLELHDQGISKMELDMIHKKMNILLELYDEAKQDYYNLSLIFYDVQNVCMQGSIGNLEYIEITGHEAKKIHENLNSMIFMLISPLANSYIYCELKFEFTQCEIK